MLAVRWRWNARGDQGGEELAILAAGLALGLDPRQADGGLDAYGRRIWSLFVSRRRSVRTARSLCGGRRTLLGFAAGWAALSNLSMSDGPADSRPGGLLRRRRDGLSARNSWTARPPLVFQRFPLTRSRRVAFSLAGEGAIASSEWLASMELLQLAGANGSWGSPRSVPFIVVVERAGAVGGLRRPQPLSFSSEALFSTFSGRGGRAGGALVVGGLPGSVVWNRSGHDGHAEKVRRGFAGRGFPNFHPAYENLMSSRARRHKKDVVDANFGTS